MFPGAQRLNRGNYVMSQLVHACRANDVTDLIVIHEHRGEPSKCVCGWVCVCMMCETNTLNHTHYPQMVF